MHFNAQMKALSVVKQFLWLLPDDAVWSFTLTQETHNRAVGVLNIYVTSPTARVSMRHTLKLDANYWTDDEGVDFETYRINGVDVSIIEDTGGSDGR